MTLFQAAIGSRTGDRHRATATPNQDHACYAHLPNNMGIVAAVSDGAGSAPLAHIGSRTAARQAITKAWRTAAKQGNQPDPAGCVQLAVKAARNALEATAAVQGNPLDHYHTTLIVAVMTKEEAAVAHVGDGASIVLHQGLHRMLTIPARGEYANETFFITMEEYKELTAANAVQNPTQLILFTDGVQNELIDFRNKKPNSQALTSLEQMNPTLNVPLASMQTENPATPQLWENHNPRLCQWLEEGHTTHHDDATILTLKVHGRPG